MTNGLIQTLVFASVLLGIAWLTYLKCRDHGRDDPDSNREYFLAGGSLSWLFVAGSITLTNLSTDQLVGMNGNQMVLLALWELAGFVGLLVLAKIFLPVYYNSQLQRPPSCSKNATRANICEPLCPCCFYSSMCSYSNPP
jgi:SSS family solute:Na+ symporter